jgi:hypothetical protein
MVELCLSDFYLHVKNDENECSVSQFIKHCNLWGIRVRAFEDTSFHPDSAEANENIFGSLSG